MISAAIETAERKEAEDQIRQQTRTQHVRLIDMTVQYKGTSGPTLAPVYVPVYIFSWFHGGVKVRTFVSGCNASQVSGTKMLDDMKIANMAAVVTSGD